MKKPASKAKKRHPKRLISLIVVLVLVVAGLTWYAVARVRHDHAVNQERIQFAQAEKDLDAMSAKIIAKFGQPEQNIKSKNCGYTSDPNEFERGDLYCYVDHVLVYSTKSIRDAKELVAKMETLSPGVHEYVANNGDSLGGSMPPIDLGGDRFMLDRLGCTTGYKYFLANTNMRVLGYPHINQLTGGEALLAEVQCSARPAKAQYFPLTN